MQVDQNHAVLDLSDKIIVDRHLNAYQASLPNIYKAYLEQAKYLARRIAKTKINNKRLINRDLQRTLLTAFADVNYAVIKTRTPLKDRSTSKENLVFILIPKGYEFSGARVLDQPQTGRMLLPTSPDGSPYIPHRDCNIPLELNEISIASLSGGLGKKIKQDFYTFKSAPGNKTSNRKAKKESHDQKLNNHDIVLARQSHLTNEPKSEISVDPQALMADHDHTAFTSSRRELLLRLAYLDAESKAKKHKRNRKGSAKKRKKNKAPSNPTPVARQNAKATFNPQKLTSPTPPPNSRATRVANFCAHLKF